MAYLVENFLNHFHTLYLFGIILIYLFLPFGLAISEEILTIIIGILVGRGYVSPFSGIVGTVLGVYLSDIICYFMGVLVDKSLKLPILSKIYKKKDRISIYDKFHNKFKGAFILIIKFLVGLKFWIYVGAGYKKFNLKTFLIEDFFAAIIFSLIYLVIGFYFGSHLNEILVFLNNFKYLLIALVVIGITIFILRRKKHEKDTSHLS